MADYWKQRFEWSEASRRKVLALALDWQAEAEEAGERLRDMELLHQSALDSLGQHAREVFGLRLEIAQLKKKIELIEQQQQAREAQVEKQADLLGMTVEAIRWGPALEMGSPPASESPPPRHRAHCLVVVKARWNEYIGAFEFINGARVFDVEGWMEELE